MALPLVLNNGITFSGSSSEVFDAYITETLDQMNFNDITRDTIDKMGFTIVPNVLNPDRKFGAIEGPQDLPVWQENSVKQEGERVALPKKGFAIVQYAEKYTVSDLFTQWAMRSNDLAGAPESIQALLFDTSENVQRLLKSSDLTYATQAVKLWTLGNAITAPFGAGSPTPKGQPLFSATQPIQFTGGTFSNLGAGALSAANIQDALTKLKTASLDNGRRPIRPTTSPYKLFVSPVLAVTARTILNTAGQMAGEYLGTGSNANAMQTFNFYGNLVEIVELDILGNVDVNGNVIGSDNDWFMTNPVYLTGAKAFKMIQLYPPMVRTYITNDTDNHVVDIKMGFAIDHYYAENGIVGYVAP